MGNLAVPASRAPLRTEAPVVPAATSRTSSFRLWQPRNLASWVFIYFLAMGVLATFRYYQPVEQADSQALALALPFFGLYTLPWIWLFHRIDRWSHIPAKLTLCAFLWGALTATDYLAVHANGAVLGIYSKTISPVFTEDWGAGLTAPFNEETAKGIGILLLIYMAVTIIRTPFDGFMIGAFVGLGFEVVEDVSYAVNAPLAQFGTNEIGAALKVIVLRSATGITSHALFSALVGTGLVFLVGTSVTRPRRLIGVGLILTGMLLHGIWDSAAAIAGRTGVSTIVVIVGAVVIDLLILWAVYRFASRTERTWVRGLLAPEIANGTLTPDEVGALSGVRNASNRFIRQHRGYPNRKAARHVLAAADDLMVALSNSDGTETTATMIARSELARVRGLGQPEFQEDGPGGLPEAKGRA